MARDEAGILREEGLAAVHHHHLYLFMFTTSGIDGGQVRQVALRTCKATSHHRPPPARARPAPSEFVRSSVGEAPARGPSRGGPCSPPRIPSMIAGVRDGARARFWARLGGVRRPRRSRPPRRRAPPDAALLGSPRPCCSRSWSSGDSDGALAG